MDFVEVVETLKSIIDRIINEESLSLFLSRYLRQRKDETETGRCVYFIMEDVERVEKDREFKLPHEGNEVVKFEQFITEISDGDVWSLIIFTTQFINTIIELGKNLLE